MEVIEVEKSIEELVIGDIIQNDVFVNTKYPILRAQTKVTLEHIQLLEDFAVSTVLVHPKENAQKEVERVVEKKTEDTAIVKKDFNKEYSQQLTQIKQAFNHYRSGGKLEIPKIRQSIVELRQIFCQDNLPLIDLVKQMNESDYWEHKAIITGLVAASIGHQLGYTEGDLNQLALAGAVMDIGMLRINPELLQKSDLFSKREKEVVMTHLPITLQAIEQTVLLREEMKEGIAQHHERLDGSGYPKQLRFRECSEIGQILAVADTFVALTSERPHRQRLEVFQALEYLKKNGLGYYRLNIVRALEKVAATLEKGMHVRLTNGLKGEIIRTSREYPLRPLLQLIPDGSNYDLAKNEDVWIQDII